MLEKAFIKLHALIGQQYGRLDWKRDDIYLALNSRSDFQRLSSCKKEPETVTWLEANLKPNDVLYDIGANVGAYSLIAAKLVTGFGKVYAFEPGFSNFSTLSKNILKNNVSQSIIPIQLALSDSSGFMNMQFSILESGGAKHVLSKERNNETTSIFVPSVNLDNFLEYFQAPPPTMIKIDVDGGEWNVIQGALKTLSLQTLKTLLIEIDFNDPKAETVVQYIESTGLNLVTKHPREKGKSLSLFNCIFYRH